MTERRKGCPECRSSVDFDPQHDLTCGACRRMVERIAPGGVAPVPHKQKAPRHPSAGTQGQPTTRRIPVTNIARAFTALGEALAHVPIDSLGVNANENELLVTVGPDGADETLRLLQLCQLAERMGLPAPTPTALRGPGARAQTIGTPGYCPDVTVVLWTPVTAGVRQVAS